MLLIELQMNNINKAINRQEILLRCDNCFKDIIYQTVSYYNKSRKKYDKDLCRGCKLKTLIQLGLVTPNTKNWIQSNKAKKGKTSVQIFGAEKAGQIKIKAKLSSKVTERNIANTGKTYEEMYGIEKALKMKAASSARTKGEKNPMYGKPSNFLTRNSLRGYYNGHYFRSSYELAYLKYLFDNDIKFESAEKKEYLIEYTLDNIKKTYYPDFYLFNTKEIIEIKPKLFCSFPKNEAKFKAAKQKFGDKFKVLTEETLILLPLLEIYDLMEKNILILKNIGPKMQRLLWKEL